MSAGSHLFWFCVLGISAICVALAALLLALDGDFGRWGWGIAVALLDAFMAGWHLKQFRAARFLDHSGDA